MVRIKRWFTSRRKVVWSEPELPPYVKINPNAEAAHQTRSSLAISRWEPSRRNSWNPPKKNPGNRPRSRCCHAGSVIQPEPLTSGQPDVKGGAMTTPASLEHEYTLATAVARYDELRMQDLLAPGADDLPAEEQPGPGPLSRQEALELLALSELIARKAAYGRQLTVRSARAAGAAGHKSAPLWALPSNPRGRPTTGDRPAGKPPQRIRPPEHG